MAMQMSGEVMLPADRATVWAALNDPEVLKRCIPGAQELEKLSDTEFQATVKAAVGPVKATFKGRVTLSQIDAPNGYTISGEGQGGVAGFAKGGAKVRLAEAEGGGTRMSYEVEANVGGKLAQLGGRLINGVAKKYADEFFDTFAKAVAPQDASAA
jgi:carbon monoxide dehydrogenase subunit G